MTLTEAFEVLKNRYGSHSAAARALDINTSYYRDIRNGRAKPSKRLQIFLEIKAFDSHETAPAIVEQKETVEI